MDTRCRRNLSAAGKVGWQHKGMTPDELRQDARREVEQPAFPGPDSAELDGSSLAQAQVEAGQERPQSPRHAYRSAGSGSSSRRLLADKCGPACGVRSVALRYAPDRSCGEPLNERHRQVHGHSRFLRVSDS